MSVHITTLMGKRNDQNVEVWAPEYGSHRVWFVYEQDGFLDDRIDMSHEQLRELYDAIDALLD